MGPAGDVTHHGFTDHEHVDNVGLIHMNGRVYDPVIVDRMSPDELETAINQTNLQYATMGEDGGEVAAVRRRRTDITESPAQPGKS